MIRGTDIAQTTPTSHAIANRIRQAYALGDVTQCELLRRGFNHVYGLRFRWATGCGTTVRGPPARRTEQHV